MLEPSRRPIDSRLIRVRGAAEHNLKNVSVDLPRQRLTVFTGVSGSGKSSLVFDTIYKEGQRRFLESLSAYARQFLGGFEKPRVDSIEGLSPTISIDQKTVGRSPRSTVGTISEVHDHLRLLFARLGEPHCPRCGRPIASQSADQICDQMLLRHGGKRALICAPLVRGRKGEYRQLFDELSRAGHTRLRVDGRLVRPGEDVPTLKRHEKHDIDIICDRLELRPENRSRLVEAIEKSLELASGSTEVMVLREGAEPASSGPLSPEAEETFSSLRACPDCGVSLVELEPRLFSFNSPHGACRACEGRGETDRVDPELIVADPGLPLAGGGIELLRGNWELVDEALDEDGFAALAKRLGLTRRTSWADLGEEARRHILHGDGMYPGLVAGLEELASRGDPLATPYLRALPCVECDGSRLNAMARAVKFHGRSIDDLGRQTVAALRVWLDGLRLEGAAGVIGAPIVRNAVVRLRYLESVGLSYLTLARRSDTLAGGEAQRLRLASQVGAGLQGVLFVLDEPSIGLHPRDNEALIRTLQQLRDQGNTVLVAEHDLRTMESADHLVDMGPGAGPLGGEVVAQGTPAQVAAEPRSLTGQYLAGARRIPPGQTRRTPGKEVLELFEASHNNLKGVDLRVPLGLFVVVTGVSGSGKSSLINHVLRPALLSRLGRRGPQPGRHRSLRGYQQLDKVVDIDQSPIGRTPRSNPATYLKIFDLIRDLFAIVPESRARGYTASRFSFNRDGGRCLECGGAGVTIVEMQFLPAVEVGCEACGGRRYNRETLEIHYRTKSIYDVLEMTVAEAAAFFADHPRIHRPLALLDRIGLGYMKLGQPSTTLSGGEAQRIKLTSELQRRDTGRTLYILDEPTTGLHFEDVRKLLGALQELVDRKNTVLVIEHATDVMLAADWLIDLGPEAGDAGGSIIVEGTPETVSRHPASHTGRALREILTPAPVALAAPVGEQRGPGTDGANLVRDILVRGARQHNLRAVEARIPAGSLTVITGVSGSGKTSLAFDTIFAEGQRRYLECLSTYARRFLGRLENADVDAIEGLSPAIAIDQKSSASNPRSTVATITEVHDYLRLLYARIGKPHCPVCAEPLRWTTPSRLAADLVRESPGEKAMILAPLQLRAEGGDLHSRASEARTELLKSGFTRLLAGEEEIRLDEGTDAPLRRILAALGEGRPLWLVVDRVVIAESAQSRIAASAETAFERGAGTLTVHRAGQPAVSHTRAPACPAGHTTLAMELTPSMFSYSSLQGACPRCKGLGSEPQLDRELVIARPDRPLPDALHPALAGFLRNWNESTLAVLRAAMAARRIAPATPWQALRAEDQAALLWSDTSVQVPVRLGKGLTHMASWKGLVPQLEDGLRSGTLGPFLGQFHALLREGTCSQCQGGRLRAESLAVRLGGQNIQELCALTVEAAHERVTGLALAQREQRIAEQALQEIDNRLRFLVKVGLGYLTLDRAAGTLSGGEAQRIRLASQLGNRLAGVLYVLDEPTVGLHQRDTRRLIDSLKELRDLGNTVLVVEHDRETMEAADWVIDMGPGAGVSGGAVVACGTPGEIASQPASITGPYLRGSAPVSPSRARTPSGWLRLEGVRHHNLQGVDVALPLGVLTAVSGVSGSGKSSLVLDVLGEVVAARLDSTSPPVGRLSSLTGVEAVRRLVLVDQRALGRTPRSIPATYTGAWDLVRDLYASLPDARVRGYGPDRFSFNAGAGRCLACEGQGTRHIEMHFLSDVQVVCEECGGQRFNRETLAIRFKGKNVGELLDMTVDEAAVLFESHPRLARILETLRAVGLGYLRLGQSAATLSGGEAQRVKLASELVAREAGGTLYILDEPTTGLHFSDVQKLTEVLQALVDAGNSLIVIEHHLDVIAAADWVIDLGPEGGAGGGRIVAAGPPSVVAACEASHTGRCLRERG